MKNSSHPNIVKYYISFTVNTKLYIVMEHHASGSIGEIIALRYPNGFEDECLIAYILKQLLSAIEYFHKNQHIHRDIKANNILLDFEGVCRLTDFGGSVGNIFLKKRFGREWRLFKK
jgi:serine/threonine-protein kinase OSR1/STK39